MFKRNFVDLKSNSGLRSNKGHNLLKSVPLISIGEYIFIFIAAIEYFCLELNALLVPLLEITALFASLVPWECKQVIISSQEVKQGIKFKEGAIKCCKEKKLLLLLMSG